MALTSAGAADAGGHVPRQLTHWRELKNSVAHNYIYGGARVLSADGYNCCAPQHQGGIPNPSLLRVDTRDLVNKWRGHIDIAQGSGHEFHAACERPQTPSLWCYLCCNEERERVSVLMFSFAAALFCSTLASFRQDQRVRDGGCEI